MAYAFVSGADAVEILAGAPTTAPNGMQYPGNWLALATPEDLAAHGVVEIVEAADPPAGQRVAARSLLVIDGVPTRQVVHEEIPLEDLKAGRLAAAAAAYDAALAVGYPATLDGDDETLQCRNELDRTNWLALLVAAQTQVALGNGTDAYPIPLRTTANTAHTVTNAEAVTLMFGLMAWAGATQAVYWGVKDAIASAADAAAVLAVDVDPAWP